MKENKKWVIDTNQLFIVCIILGSITRCLPHPPNLSPMMGLSIFGVAHLTGKWRQYSVPLIISFLSDLFLNNVVYREYFDGFTFIYFGWQYLAYLIIIAVSGWILKKKRNIRYIFSSSLAGTLIFFFISNFGVWFNGSLYTPNLSGLIECYIAGLPFLKTSMLGNLLYTSVFFGIFAWLRKKHLALSKS